MIWLGKELGYKNMCDWYQLSVNAFAEHHGRTLIDDKYGCVPFNAVKDAFPQYDWKPWLFQMVPVLFWQKKRNRIAYLEWLGERLGFKRKKDWEALAFRAIRKNRGSYLLEKFPLAQIKKERSLSH